MKRILVLGLMVALAGCSTPQERCIGTVTRDLRVVDRLIAETEGNLARGYAYTTLIERRPAFVDCTPEPTADKPDPAERQCLVVDELAVSSPVAIDLNDEAAKLESLKEKRAQLAASVTSAVAACRQQYPE